MKLRSESSKVAASATPIPFMLSATQAMYVKTESLLRYDYVKLIRFSTTVPSATRPHLSSVSLRN